MIPLEGSTRYSYDGGGVMPTTEMARIHADVDRAFYNEMIDAWPWGIRGQMIRVLLELALKATKRHGPSIIGLILSGDVELRPRDGRKLTASEKDHA